MIRTTICPLCSPPIKTAKDIRQGPRSCTATKKTVYRTGCYLKRSASGALLSSECEGFPSRSPVRHVAGVQDSPAPHQKACGVAAASSVVLASLREHLTRTSVCLPRYIAYGRNSRANPTGQLQRRT